MPFDWMATMPRNRSFAKKGDYYSALGEEFQTAIDKLFTGLLAVAKTVSGNFCPVN